MNLIELQNKIHQQNVDMGWWDEPRPFSTFVCLFHSELSEAMEGDRKGLMDDHLPQYPMFWVEIADYAIRLLDYLGSVRFTWPVGVFCTSNYNKIKDLEFLHRLTSNAGMHPEGDGRNLELANAVRLCFAMSELHKVDLHQIILEKVEYNKHRADHKRENRAKDGGKKY